MSPLIYLVDDEPLLMELLGQYLIKSKKTWKVECFGKPQQAIEATRQQPPDIVVSDFNMPEINGTMLLETIRQAAPNTIRILVSGYADPQSLGDKLCSAHQYIAKPFSMADISSTIHKALNALQSFQNASIRSAVLAIRTLPAIPQIYYRLLATLEDPRSSCEDVEQILKQDEAICAKTLQMANSPLFCLSSRGKSIIELLQAITLLGTERIKAVILSHQLFSRHSEVPECFMPGHLSSHRWSTADLSLEFARKIGFSEDLARDAYVVGLMHDLGRLILLENFPGAYDEACQQALLEKKTITQIEQQMFGLTQGDIVGFLATLWGLSERICQGLIYQEKPWEAPNPDALQTATTVYLAHRKAHLLHASEKFEQPALNMEFMEKNNFAHLLEAGH